MRINNIHNFVYKIIYKEEQKDNGYKAIICLYIINILILSSVFIHFQYLKNKKHFNLRDIINIEINRNINNNLIINNEQSNDTINTERFNIKEYISRDSNNKSNKKKK